MGKIYDGPTGGWSGKLGSVVGYRWRGVWCLRCKPAVVRNPRSEAQQRHRAMFREEVRLASRLNWALRETFEELSLAAGMTPCNYFVKENQRCFGWEEERLTVDWEHLALSHGPVAPVAFGVPEVTDGTVLRISFEKNPLGGRAYGRDKVYLLVYCEALGQCCLSTPVYRADRRVGVVLPEWFAGEEVQLYGFVQDDCGRWSETIYIGYGPLVQDVTADGRDVTRQVPDGRDVTRHVSKDDMGRDAPRHVSTEGKTVTTDGGGRDAPRHVSTEGGHVASDETEGAAKEAAVVLRE